MHFRLSTGTSRSRSPGCIQHPELNPGCIRSLPHLATESVDFLDQVTFADTPDRRVAGHLRDGFA